VPKSGNFEKRSEYRGQVSMGDVNMVVTIYQLAWENIG
jgi:hypothetical protein